MPPSLLDEILAVETADPAEAQSKERIAAHVRAGGALFDRNRWDGHLTASGFIVDASEQRLLLVFHKKLSRWLQPGGHGEPGDVHPLSVARREVLEEVGLELDPHPDLPAPFDLDVHRIPARPAEPSHEHLDIRYVFRAPKDATIALSERELDGSRWVPLAEVTIEASDASVARAARKLRSRLTAAE